MVARRVATLRYSEYSTSKQKLTLPLGWEAVIGIECHAQLTVPNKLFSATQPTSRASPNTHVAPFDIGYPGTLPRLQKTAVDAAIRAALAMNCTIADRSIFERKHYFYADQPLGYQITQRRSPYAYSGSVSVCFEDGFLSSEEASLQVPIEQIQLEQDTAKSSYFTKDAEKGTERVQLLDFNRAGVALIEIVSAPAMRTPEQAGAYVRKIRDLLRCVNASDGNMNEGSLRCDANVSIHRIGTPFGTRCEIKNLNSVKFLLQAVNFEMQRQFAVLENSGTIQQESRGFDEARGVTYLMRSKEDALDYRYMHEPNLTPLQVTREHLEQVRASLPELPDDRNLRLRSQYSLTTRDLNVLTRVNADDDVAAPTKEKQLEVECRHTRNAVEFFEAVVCEGIEPQSAMNWTIHHLLKELNAAQVPFAQSPIPPTVLAELIRCVSDGTITAKTAHYLLRESIYGNISLYRGPQMCVKEVITSLELNQLRTPQVLRPYCTSVLQQHPKDVQAIKNGKTKALQKLVGAVMRESNGRADAIAATQLLKEMLAST
ncbi:hypothetical protein MYAM1_002910 [Malassezia yamatoensis]|uniref:Glutamyl-tRNA(Gln) amidotransferase subunit B, mitochondrial n=1 Tax=Malassezia yamatoensis TaxID=253288 RepID=A0AAJ5YZ04_9BASI|nr:hypothetical protein MYAM1_002910 [Malassezia yamatoensis]